MEIKENMYVRTDIGEIGKITSVSESLLDLGMCGYAYNSEPYLKGNEVATSYDILDLLKPFDLMYIDIDPYDGLGGIVVPRIAETVTELGKYKALIKMGEYKLISITTYEKINNNSYRVGD